MTPAGTSNELDVHNEWEENTHATLCKEKTPRVRSNQSTNQSINRPFSHPISQSIKTFRWNELRVRRCPFSVSTKLYLYLHSSSEHSTQNYNLVCYQVLPTYEKVLLELLLGAYHPSYRCRTTKSGTHNIRTIHQEIRVRRNV